MSAAPAADARPCLPAGWVLLLPAHPAVLRPDRSDKAEAACLISLR